MNVDKVQIERLECPFCYTEFSPEEHAFRARACAPTASRRHTSRIHQPPRCHRPTTS